MKANNIRVVIPANDVDFIQEVTHLQHTFYYYFFYGILFLFEQTISTYNTTKSSFSNIF